MSTVQRERLTAIQPLWAIEGGRIHIEGSAFPIDGTSLPQVRIGDQPARLVFASADSLTVLVPSGLPGGRTPVRVEGVSGETAFVEIGAPVATGLHQVDNPIFDSEGNLYVTYSGSRGQQVPVSIFRVRPNGTRESFVSGIVNPTSMAFGPHGDLFVSSRFEGTVYRVRADASVEPFATDLGVACGLAFAPEGTLFVGDRSGTIFQVDAAGRTTILATLPASVAAFHMAVGADGALYVTAPTLNAYDHVYRISQRGTIDIIYSGFGRPQGLAFDSRHALYVVEALAGWSGVYRLHPNSAAELTVAGPSLIGLAFDPRGGLVVASNETAYRLDVNIRPAR